MEKELVYTPQARTIEEVSNFLGKEPKDFVKTLLYNVDGKTMAFCVPGDRELNETKAVKLLLCNEFELSDFEDVERITHANVGFAGPIGLDCPVYVDRQILHMKNFIVGANKSDYHYKNVNCKDLKPTLVADLSKVKEGDICPNCGKPLTFKHGIEVGNLFNLGCKYSDMLGLLFTNQNNQPQPVWMGCYGIGLGRCMAAVVEQHYDDKGIIWPVEIAPFTLCIVPVSTKDEKQMQIAGELYDWCKQKGYDVLLDDRNERPGVKFKDMELIGIPYRITVGRGIANGVVEFVERENGEKVDISLDAIKSKIDEIFK